jgi:integrase
MHQEPIQKPRTLPTGITERHSRSCPTRVDRAAQCACDPAYQAWAYDRRIEYRATDGSLKRGKKIKKTFSGNGALTEAKRWRAKATTQIDEGKSVARSRLTLSEAVDQWLAGAEAEPPIVLTRGGQPYKPSVLRGYRYDLKQHVIRDLGPVRLSDVRRGDLQKLVDRMIGKGLSGSKVRNAIVALRVVYRWAVERELVASNPTLELRVPTGSNVRDRAATAAEAAELLAALPDDVRPVYATAFYAGLRRGELRGLRWSDVDLANGLIHVRRGWDDVAGEIAPKSAKGTRNVPIVALLHDELARHKTSGDPRAGEYVFGSKHAQPFTPSNMRKRAAKAWEAENTTRAEEAKKKGDDPVLLVPIGLHECRHTFVSMLADAGLPLEQIGDYVGHSSTFMVDRYRHLLAGHEDATRRLVDAYLARTNTAERLRQLEGS